MSAPFDVVVVGFGPTGATLANLLGRDGVRTLVVERSPELYTLPRAVHFDHEVMRVFQSVGLAEAILPHTGPVEGYEFRNAEGRVILAFDLRDRVTSQGWRADYMFHQPSLERILREGAEAREGVEVRLGRELVALEEDADGVALTLRDPETGDEEVVRARYVVGCDGAASATRRLAGLASEDLRFDEPWLVVDASIDRPPEALGLPREVVQYCDPARPVTYVPVAGPYVRWEFMLLPGEGEAMRDPARVRALLARHVDPDALTLLRTAVYRFHAVVARDWRRGRTLLAGDAAHQMPPFLGQGMCAGVRDAANLAWKLGLVLRGEAREALLDSYGVERAAHVRRVIDTAVEMGRIICTTDPDVAAARDAELLAGRGTTHEAPGLPGLVEGFLQPAPRPPLVGTPALQATVRDAAGRTARLDDVTGPGFTLLWRGAAGALPADARARLARIGVRQVALVEEGAAGFPADDPALLCADDLEGCYADWLDAHGVRAVLVRPDHAVFGVAADDAAVPALLAQADALLGPSASATTGTV